MKLDELDLDGLAAQVVIPVLDLRALGQRRPVSEGERPPTREAVLERARDLARRGVGGFILFGGHASTLRDELAWLRALSRHGLLIGADLERGVGQQVEGAAHLPPLLALGAANSEALASEAGQAVGREALAHGIDWIYAPVLDLADEPRNPIIGTRSLGPDPARVAALGARFIRGLQEPGAVACAKHWPGHGATTDDSHASLPVVRRAADDLRARDLAPFHAAIVAGASSIMTAHVVYPTLSSSGLPGTLDPAIATDLLRREAGFAGLVVTDALIMDGVLQGRTEGEAACLALEAGCDALLYPRDPLAVIAKVRDWAASSPLHLDRLRSAAARVLEARAIAAATRARVGTSQRTDAAGASTITIDREVARRESVDVAERIARASIARLGPARPALKAGDEVAVVVLDDDGVPGLGHEVVAALDAAGVGLSPAALSMPAGPVTAATPPLPAAALDRARAVVAGGGRLLAVVGCRVRAWKGRSGLAPALADVLRALPGDRATVVALCGSAPLTDALPSGCELLLAWGDEPPAQRAVAAVLLGAPAPGKSPGGDPRGESGARP